MAKATEIRRSTVVIVALATVALMATLVMTTEASGQERRGERDSIRDGAQLTLNDVSISPDKPATATGMVPGEQYLRNNRQVRATSAKRNGVSLAAFDQLLRTDSSVYVDGDGMISFFDSFAPSRSAQSFAAKAASSGGSLLWPTSQTFGLHSNPGAGAVIYLDFDGDPSGSSTLPDAPPWTLDADATEFSVDEHAHIQAVWQEVADDFAAFDVDVTTELPPGLGIVGNIRHVIYGHSAAYHSAYCPISWCAGAAGLGGSVARVFARPSFSAHVNAATTAHELGHNYGLSHDNWDAPGYPNVAYKGHGNWAPTMGGPLTRGITHFATGNYASTALNPQDDMAIITAAIGGLRTDDHANDGDWANATQLPAASATVAGVIESRDDTDAFVYDVPCAGTVAVDVAVPTHGANLDVELSIFDLAAPGSALAVANPPTASAIEYPASGLDASASVPAAPGDSLALVIDGVGEFTEGLDGYSDYGTLGGYSLTVQTVCDTSGETAPLLAIVSPAPGTTLFGSTATVVGSVEVGSTTTVSVSFVDAAGAPQEIMAAVAADGSWEARIPVAPADVYDVTAAAPDLQAPSAIATTSFTVWQEPQGAPGYISVVQPERNAEVATPVRLAGIAFDDVGLGAPSLTLQHPDGRYWDGASFVVDRVDLPVTSPGGNAPDDAWDYVFDPAPGDVADGSYTARIALGQAVVGDADYTTFRIGADTTPPTLVRLTRPNLLSTVLEWEVADDHALGIVDVAVTNANGSTTTVALPVSGYDATVMFDTSTVPGSGPYEVSARLSDLAGNVVDLPSLTIGGYGDDFRVLADPVSSPVVDRTWTLAGTNELLWGGPGVDLSFIETSTAASSDIGTVRWDPVWGWHPGSGGGGLHYAGDGVGPMWSTDVHSFGSHPHTVLVDGIDTFGTNASFIGGFDFAQVDVELAEFELDVRAHLEGPFDAAADAMSDRLREFGILPATDPYGGSVTADPAVLATTGIRAPVDWVLVELRPVANPAGGVVELPALILRDGSIVGPDGYSPLDAPVATDEYYLTLTHRNHLPATIRVDLGPRSRVHVDLGVSSQSDLGGVGAHQLCDGSGPCRLLGGNGARGGVDLYQINGADKSVWLDVNGLFGTYEISDYNLDGEVNGGDKIVWNGNNGLFGQLPPW